MRFVFSAMGTAVCLPAIKAIGVGWFSTISAGFLVAAAASIYLTIQRGAQWRDAIVAKEQRKLLAREPDGRAAAKKT